MKKNRLFILFSMIFLITTISLTSIARAVAIKQDTTDVSSDDTEKNKEQETGSSSAADEQRTDEQETALSTTDQQKDEVIDRKSTRLNSSHQKISYAVFCLKK